MLVIMSTVVLMVTLLSQGSIPTTLAALAIVLISIALSLGGFPRFIARIGIPLLSLLTTSIALSGGKSGSIIEIISSFLTLIIIATAIYLMFLPFRRR
jgi:hypothetical protein